MRDWQELIIRLSNHGVDAQYAAEFIYEYLVRRLEDDPNHFYAEDDERIIEEINSFVWRGVWE